MRRPLAWFKTSYLLGKTDKFTSVKKTEVERVFKAKKTREAVRREGRTGVLPRRALNAALRNRDLLCTARVSNIRKDCVEAAFSEITPATSVLNWWETRDYSRGPSARQQRLDCVTTVAKGRTWWIWVAVTKLNRWLGADDLPGEEWWRYWRLDSGGPVGDLYYSQKSRGEDELSLNMLGLQHSWSTLRRVSLGVGAGNWHPDTEAWSSDVCSGTTSAGRRAGQATVGEIEKMKSRRRVGEGGTRRGLKGEISHSMQGPHLRREGEKPALAEPEQAIRKASPYFSPAEKQLRKSRPPSVVNAVGRSNTPRTEKHLLAMVLTSSERNTF